MSRLAPHRPSYVSREDELEIVSLRKTSVTSKTRVVVDVGPMEAPVTHLNGAFPLEDPKSLILP